jgi:hypothetical protein
MVTPTNGHINGHARRRQQFQGARTLDPEIHSANDSSGEDWEGSDFGEEEGSIFDWSEPGEKPDSGSDGQRPIEGGAHARQHFSDKTRSSRKPLISQAELRELADLRKLAQRKDALRRSIMARLEQGAVIESGKLTAKVEVAQQTRCSWQRLAEIMSETQVRQIRAMIAPTPCRSLVLFETNVKNSSHHVSGKAELDNRRRRA